MRAKGAKSFCSLLWQIPSFIQIQGIITTLKGVPPSVGELHTDKISNKMPPSLHKIFSVCPGKMFPWEVSRPFSTCLATNLQLLVALRLVLWWFFLANSLRSTFEAICLHAKTLILKIIGDRKVSRPPSQIIERSAPVVPASSAYVNIWKLPSLLQEFQYHPRKASQLNLYWWSKT